MPQLFVKPENLGSEFSIGGVEANQITLVVDNTLAKDPISGAIGLSASALQIVAPDPLNLLNTDANGKALFTATDFQAAETALTQNAASAGFMTVTPGGTNGHDLTTTFNWTDVDFVEAVTDAVGTMVVDAADGLEFDDLTNTLASVLGNLAFGDGLVSNGSTNVAVQPDPASPSTVSVSAAGVFVTPGISTDAVNVAKLGTDNKVLVSVADLRTNLATEQIQDAFGVDVCLAFPQA